MIPSITLTSWRRSIACLAFQFHQLNHRSNLLGEKSTEAGKFFFSDNGIPKPRPCTAFAWASLCAFGPSNGFFRFTDGAHQPYDPSDSRFLLPFLPKLRANEDTNQSLARTSRYQIKNSLGDIRWGKVYIGDSTQGNIEEELAHGMHIVKDWHRIEDRIQIQSILQCEIPPLWGVAGGTWQFGVIQPVAGMGITFRDPMIELAKKGIPELSYAGKTTPLVRSVLFRFLDIQPAIQWAKAYSESLSLACHTPESIRSDFELLIQDIRKHRLHEVEGEAKSKDSKSRLGLDIDVSDIMSQLSGLS